MTNHPDPYKALVKCADAILDNCRATRRARINGDKVAYAKCRAIATTLQEEHKTIMAQLDAIAQG